MTRSQTYRAKSGVLVVNNSDTPCAERDNLVRALYETYAKWYRRYRGQEPGPGKAGNVS